MKKIFIKIIIGIILLIPSKINAQEFFDTSQATSFFSLGARLGFNTSNKTFPSGYYNIWNNNSWGTGFTGGIIANLNFREYLSIQPGLFYESRSGDYNYFTEYLNTFNEATVHYDMGHVNTYNVTVPIMAIVKFNLADYIKWSVELGPYVQYTFKQIGQNNIEILYRLPQSSSYSSYIAAHKDYDVGLKLGSGLQFFRHYYIGFHYMAGLMNAWNLPPGGKKKSWQFTVGYDF